MNRSRLLRLALDMLIVLAITLPLLVLYQAAALLHLSAVFWIYFVALGLSATAYGICAQTAGGTHVSPNEENTTQEPPFVRLARRACRPLAWLTAALSLVFLYDIFTLFLYDPLAEIFPFIWGIL